MASFSNRSGIGGGNLSSRALCPSFPRPSFSPRPSGRMQMRHLQHGQKTYGFFNLFGGDKSAGADDQYSEVETGPDRDWSNQGVDEVVITTWTDDSGKEYDIVYRNGGLVDAASVEILCDKIQWPRRPQEKLDAALKNSFLVSSITLEERGCPPEKRRLIGSARCTSDGAFNATIWDVMVDPEFQGLGLGKALLELMVRSLLQREISNITLFADSQVVSFYKKLGFDVDPEGIKGMFFRFESSMIKLRERVIELEDSRDSLQTKYDRVMSDYKTLKGEIRSEIECQKSLDEAHVKLAAVDKKKDNVASLEKELQRCTLRAENILVDLHLTESSLNEAMQKYHALERDTRKEDCSLIKRDLFAYRDQAEQCLMFTESNEKKNEELAKQVEQQRIKLEEYAIMEESLRSTRNELDLAKIRMTAVEKDAQTLKVVQKDLARVQNELASSVSALEASRNELNATKTALNSLLESLDSRLQYESLREEHEKEILPYWLRNVVERIQRNIYITYQSSVQPLFEYLYEMLQETKLYFKGQICGFLMHAQQTVNAVLHPIALKADSALFRHTSIKKYRQSLLIFAEKQSLQLKMKIISVRERGRLLKADMVTYLEAFVSRASHKIPALQKYHTPAVARTVFNLLLAAIVIPLGLFILNAISKGIVYYCRPGTARICVDEELQAVSTLEHSINYRFSRRDYALQALEQSPSLHQVGLALINLILAEQQGNDPAKTFAELEHRSSRTCIDTIVRPGPGRKSIKVAAQQKVYMYVCLLAAVFRDSEESVEQVFKVWNSTSSTPLPRQEPSIDEDDISNPHVEEVHKSSTSTSPSVSSDGSETSDNNDDGDEKASS